MPEIAFDEEYEGGKLIRRTQRTISDAEIERRDMPTHFRTRLPQLRQWATDAQDAAALTTMTAAQRIARQAEVERRVAALARLVAGLIWAAGHDDGG